MNTKKDTICNVDPFVTGDGSSTHISHLKTVISNESDIKMDESGVKIVKANKGNKGFYSSGSSNNINVSGIPEQTDISNPSEIAGGFQTYAIPVNIINSNNYNMSLLAFKQKPHTDKESFIYPPNHGANQISSHLLGQEDLKQPKIFALIIAPQLSSDSVNTHSGIITPLTSNLSHMHMNSTGVRSKRRLHRPLIISSNKNKSSSIRPNIVTNIKNIALRRMSNRKNSESMGKIDESINESSVDDAVCGLLKLAGCMDNLNPKDTIISKNPIETHKTSNLSGDPKINDMLPLTGEQPIKQALQSPTNKSARTVKNRVHMCSIADCYRIFPSKSRLSRHERSHK